MEMLFIVGAQRSGTTYLYNILDAHPEIYMAKPVRPEPKYFLNLGEYDKGKEYYESKFFNHYPSGVKYLGEKSTSYIESKDVALRIRSYYPGARILFILRDPIERAYSNYRFSVEHALENLSFGDALLAENERLLNSDYTVSVNPYLYKKRGRYIEFINNYAEVFDRSQLYIMIHEEFVCSKEAITDLYEWLGVDMNFMPEIYREKANEGKVKIEESRTAIVEKYGLHDEFIESNKSLEKFLGRKIKAWQRG